MFNKWTPLILLVFHLTGVTIKALRDVPEEGYIIYCPCMGRFGNQAEQLLGSLLFAKSLNRTLVLPPFIHYGYNHTPELIPFENVIAIDPIKDYHNVVTLTDFMRHHATDLWPSGNRIFFCYSARNIDAETCDALKGQPYEKFWSTFNISEDGAIFYKPLSTSYHHIEGWKSKFPPTSHRILAFVGAPSSFPAYKDAIRLQRHIRISDDIKLRALDFKRTKGFDGKPFLSMHIRHGSDWKKACQLLKSSGGLNQFFSSAQCTGYDSISQTRLEYETCLPSYETISQKLNQSLDVFKAQEKCEINHVHIATDHDDPTMWKYLKEDFQDIEFIFSPRDHSMMSTMLDIYLMTTADVLIGNCISSFSAFPARIRSHQPGLDGMTFYFGFNLRQTGTSFVNEEL